MPIEDTASGPELSDLETALGALVPSPIAARDRILFQAGRASVSARSGGWKRRVWPAMAAGFGLIAAGEAALLAIPPSPEIVIRTVVDNVPAPAPPNPEAPRTQAVADEPVAPRPLAPRFEAMTVRDRLNDQILGYGLDGVPTPARNVGPDNRLPVLTGRDLLRQELRSALFPGDRS